MVRQSPRLSAQRNTTEARETAPASEIESDARVCQLQKEKKRLETQLAKLSVQSTLVVDEVRDLFQGRPILVDVPPRPQNVPNAFHDEIAVLCLSDAHFGHCVTAGAEAYSVEIAKQRVLTAVDKFLATVDSRRTSANIREVRLYLLGDMVDGEMMRSDHAHEIEGSVLQQACVWAPEALTAAIMQLLAEFGSVRVVAVPGNHGRNGPKKGGAHFMTNWDIVCYETTKLMVTNAIRQNGGSRLEDVSWDLPLARYEGGSSDWSAIDTVFGWVNLLSHGEDIGSASGYSRIPYYGVERTLHTNIDLVDEPVDYMFVGHLHAAASIPSNHRKVFVNGAICSTSRYALKECRKLSPPSQLAVFYTAEHGPISTSELYLADRMPTGVRTLLAMARQGYVTLSQ